MPSEMTHDTTPVVGEVWERDGDLRFSIYAVTATHVYVIVKDDMWSRFTISEWHAWAANARRVG